MKDLSINEKAYAKINLSLDIIEKLPSGMHGLESVMQTVSLFDEVFVTRESDSSGIKIKCSDSSVPTDEKNTCYKAANEFFKHIGAEDFGITIAIDKHIPSMAGLGGGSADAAAVLRALNKLYGAGLDNDELRAVAARVGADVPFLIEGGCALCSGFGEAVSPIERKSSFYILLIKPDFGISTPMAYKQFDEKSIVSLRSSKALASALEAGDDIYELISNDLERAVMSNEIQAIKLILLSNGAKAAMMTGSGSCVFGLFDSLKDVLAAFYKLRNSYSFVNPCQTVDRYE